MQRFLFVATITMICFAVQLLFLKVLGAGFVPNFVLIAVVFLNLYRATRMSLGAAFLGGFLLDSFSGNIFGINTFTLVLCALLSGSLKMFIYRPGVAESRVMVVFVIVFVNGFIQYFINLTIGADLRFEEAFVRVVLPETLLTAFVANYTFERLKECALKLFAS